MSRCDTCNTRLLCTDPFKQNCKNSGYKYYAPHEYGGVDKGNTPKQTNDPKCFIRIVITDEAKRISGDQSNVYLFTNINFEVATINLCGKEFVQVREVKTGKPTLILDISSILIIDYEYHPNMTY